MLVLGALESWVLLSGIASPPLPSNHQTLAITVQQAIKQNTTNRSGKQASKQAAGNQATRRAGRHASKPARLSARPPTRAHAQTERQRQRHKHTQDFCSARVSATGETTPKLELTISLWQPCMREWKLEKTMCKNSTHRQTTAQT